MWIKFSILFFTLYLLHYAFESLKYVRFEALTAVTMKNAVFWDVAPCRYCVNRRFGGTYRLHLHGRKIRKRGCSYLLTLIPRLRIFLHKIYMAPHFRRWHSLWNMSTFRTISLFHGAESFLRSHQLLSYSGISQHFMEPEGSLPYSQEPSTVHILSQINLVHTTLSYVSKIHFNIILPPTSRTSFPSSFPTKTLYSLLPQACYMPCPSHPPWLGQSDYIWRRMQFKKLLIMHFRPTSCYFISLRPRYSHHVPKYRTSVF
jgi:hypothetical protein